MAALYDSPSVAAADVLIVDAETSARGRFAQDLKTRGYRVQEAGTAENAASVLTRSKIDVLILDVALPAQNGVEIMRRARQQYRDLLIIVLTAHASVDSAIAAVKVGVVDYMLKPCKADDVVLTIARALEERAQRLRHERLLNMVGDAIDALRQPAPATIPVLDPVAATASDGVSHSMRVGVLSLDCQKRLLTIKTSPPRTVELTEGEVSILVKLMEKPNEVFTYKQLAESALGYDNMDKWTIENVIRSTVFRLRHKIESGPDAPRVICTVRGRGYYLSAT